MGEPLAVAHPVSVARGIFSELRKGRERISNSDIGNGNSGNFRIFEIMAIVRFDGVKMVENFYVKGRGTGSGKPQ